jgi:hypothetical protein
LVPVVLLATPAASGEIVGEATPSISVTELPAELAIQRFPDISIVMLVGELSVLLV